MKETYGTSAIFFGVYYLWVQFHTYVDVLENSVNSMVNYLGKDETEVLLAKKLFIIHLAYELLDALRQSPIEDPQLFEPLAKPWMQCEELEKCSGRQDLARLLVRFDQETLSWCHELIVLPGIDLPTSRFLLLTITQASQSIESLTAQR